MEDQEGIDQATLFFDDALPLVGFHGRANPQGGLEALGFIWDDQENRECRRPLKSMSDKGKPLSYDEAESLITYDDMARAEEVEGMEVEDKIFTESDSSQHFNAIDLMEHQQDEKRGEILEKMRNEMKEQQGGVVDSTSNQALKDLIDELLAFEQASDEDMDWLSAKLKKQRDITYENQDKLDQEFRETLVLKGMLKELVDKEMEHEKAQLTEAKSGNGTYNGNGGEVQKLVIALVVCLLVGLLIGCCGFYCLSKFLRAGSNKPVRDVQLPGRGDREGTIEIPQTERKINDRDFATPVTNEERARGDNQL